MLIRCATFFSVILRMLILRLPTAQLRDCPKWNVPLYHTSRTGPDGRGSDLIADATCRAPEAALRESRGAVNGIARQ
jgi:hypothetical protein